MDKNDWTYTSLYRRFFLNNFSPFLVLIPFQAIAPGSDRDLDASVEAREFQASINSLLNEYDDRFVSRGYEELLDEKIVEIQREAERLEQRLWGGKEKDFKF